MTLHEPRGMDTQGSVRDEESSTCGKGEGCQQQQGWEEVSRAKKKKTTTYNAFFQWCHNALIHSFSVWPLLTLS